MDTIKYYIDQYYNMYQQGAFVKGVFCPMELLYMGAFVHEGFWK